MSDALRSEGVPPLAPDDWIRGAAIAGGGPVLIEYADFECPFCAALWERLQAGREGAAGASEGGASGPAPSHVFRHFPVKSAHPRAWAAACAAEAAGRQGRFWEMHDLLFADQGRLEDPHLWERAERLGIDLERFDRDRRSEEVAARVRRDFMGGVRAGVVTTPTAFVEGRAYHGEALRRLVESLRGG